MSNRCYICFSKVKTLLVCEKCRNIICHEHVDWKEYEEDKKIRCIFCGKKGPIRIILYISFFITLVILLIDMISSIVGAI